MQRIRKAVGWLVGAVRAALISAWTRPKLTCHSYLGDSYLHCCPTLGVAVGT